MLKEWYSVFCPDYFHKKVQSKPVPNFFQNPRACHRDQKKGVFYFLDQPSFEAVVEQVQNKIQSKSPEERCHTKVENDFLFITVKSFRHKRANGRRQQNWS